MNKNQVTKEKICAFYASDYHFEMISLPYIKKQIDNNRKVVILTENNLKETMEKLLERMSLENEEKDKILNIDWDSNNLDKLMQIKQNSDTEKEIIVFVKGKENYIRNINQNIERFIGEYTNSKVIDCYDIEEVGENVDNVMGNYGKLLNVSGEKEIQKI